uniref:NAD(P)-binding domain-containing protein n=1 Tax=Globisporangium ultimum (strain ATCC 200006 / CBS 805.95 / DAOM BR144) TaxID=431595 RepID=K3X6R9_GLOUD
MAQRFLLPIAQHAGLHAHILRAAVASSARPPASLAFRVVMSSDASPATREAVHALAHTFPQLVPEKPSVVDMRSTSELAEALENCDGVVLSSGLQDPDALFAAESALVDTAKGSGGTQRIVKVSGAAGLVGKNAALALGRAHWQIEQALQTAALSAPRRVDIVRPSTGMDSLLDGRLFDMVCGRTLSVSVKHGKVAFVHPMDTAEVIVSRLLQQGRGDADTKSTIETFHVTGPDALTYEQVAQELSAGIGDRVRYSYFPLWAVNTARWIQGVRPDAIAAEIELSRALENGADADVTRTVDTLLGKPARTFTSFVKENKNSWPLKAHT